MIFSLIFRTIITARILSTAESSSEWRTPGVAAVDLHPSRWNDVTNLSSYSARPRILFACKYRSAPCISTAMGQY